MEKLTNLMQKSGSVLLCVLAHSAVLISLGMRYGMIGVEGVPRAYVIDKWTGRMWYCDKLDCYKVYTKRLEAR